MRHHLHERAEILAGAITLGEATDDERIEYRRHLAACAPCLHAVGGEHELARISGIIVNARESEVWEADVRAPLISRLGGVPRRFLTYGLSFLALCLFVSLIAHLIVGSELTQMRPTLQDPLTISYEGNRIVLERRSLRDQKPTLKARPQVVVNHNVVRAIVRPRLLAATKQVAASIHRRPNVRPGKRMAANETASGENPKRPNAAVAADSVDAAVPKSRNRARLGSAPEIGLVAAPARSRSIERIAFAPSYITREAAPEGGDTAINPKYNELAYEERAEGTVSYEVTVDAQGNPTNFAIVSSSGFLVLDKAVKDAAMTVHYRPALLNGKPVAGIYHDAITFHAASTGD